MFEYVLVVSKELDKERLIERALRNSRFVLKEFATLDQEYKYLGIKVPENAYRLIATNMKLFVETKDNHLLIQYDKDLKDDFIPFSQSQKHLMLMNQLDENLDVRK